MGGLSGRMSVELSAGPKRDSDASISAAIEGGVLVWLSHSPTYDQPPSENEV